MSGPGRGNWVLKHGGSRRGLRLPEYGVWAKMRVRCQRETSPDFKNYGGRGIAVCDRWQEFQAFYDDMGPRPSPKHTIERLDNDAGYEPRNCIWATRAVQNRNRRSRALKTHCKNGHLLDGDNVYVRPEGKRACRTCRALNMRNFYSRHKKEATDAVL